MTVRNDEDKESSEHLPAVGFMTKADFLKSVANMTEEQKRELLVELQTMSKWISEGLLDSKSVIEGAGAAGKSYAAMFGVN
jgi:hypothetical protein